MSKTIAAIEERAPRHGHDDALGREEGDRFGLQPLDRQVFEDVGAIPEPDVHAPDVQRPLHEPRALLLGLRTQGGPRSAETVVTNATARITAQTITVRRTNVRTVRVTG